MGFIETTIMPDETTAILFDTERKEVETIVLKEQAAVNLIETNRTPLETTIKPDETTEFLVESMSLDIESEPTELSLETTFAPEDNNNIESNNLPENEIFMDFFNGEGSGANEVEE